MKTKLLRKLRKKCFILRGVIYDKKTLKQLNEYGIPISNVCLYLEIIGFYYWLNHIEKMKYNKNKKKYLKSLNR